jgi:type IV secretion system protein VirB9
MRTRETERTAPLSRAGKVRGRGVAWLCGALGMVLAGAVHAERAPKEGPQDSRIRTVVYNPRDVVRIEVHYGYQTEIEFGDDEHIETLALGDSVSWEAVQDGSQKHLFLKPKEEHANTNLTVITDRRTYTFALVGKDARAGAHVAAMTWRVHFEYPDATPTVVPSVSSSSSQGTGTKAAFDPRQFHLGYAYAGSRTMVPTQLFDDGTSTYFRFDRMRDLPAIFVVDEVDGEKKETLANYRIEGPYVVVERVARQFSLRIGRELTWIFNEALDVPQKGTPVNGPHERTLTEAEREPPPPEPRRPGHYVHSRKNALPERSAP